MALVISDLPEQARFEAHEGDSRAGFVEYIRTEAGLIVYTHTEVDPAFEGQGVGTALARYVLDYARSNKLAVLPLCPFIAKYIHRHQEYADLVYRPKPSTARD